MITRTPYETFRSQAAQDVRDAMNEHRALEWAERAVDAVILRYVNEYLRTRKPAETAPEHQEVAV